MTTKVQILSVPAILLLLPAVIPGLASGETPDAMEKGVPVSRTTHGPASFYQDAMKLDVCRVTYGGERNLILIKLNQKTNSYGL